MNARNVEKRFKRWWYLFTKFHAFFHETFSTTTDTKFMFAMKCLRLIVLQFGFLSHFQTMKFYGWTRIPYRHVTVLLLYIIFNRYNVDIRSSSTPRITVHVSHHLIFVLQIATLNQLQFKVSNFNISFNSTKSSLAVSINAIIFPHAIYIPWSRYYSYAKLNATKRSAISWVLNSNSCCLTNYIMFLSASNIRRSWNKNLNYTLHLKIHNDMRNIMIIIITRLITRYEKRWKKRKKRWGFFSSSVIK